MKIAVTSDLHGYLPDWKSELGGVELLLICGDIMPLDIQINMVKSREWLIGPFWDWIEELPVEKCYFIPGNHDFIFERSRSEMYSVFPEFTKSTLLCNDYTEHISNDGNIYKIFGTPYCKYFGNWAFMRDDSKLLEYYSLIPENLDILISHDAPRLDNLGCIMEEGNRWYGTEAGNKVLADVVMLKKPRYCFCGHIHSGNHTLQDIDGIKAANTSAVNEKYQLVYKPLIVDINGKD